MKPDYSEVRRLLRAGRSGALGTLSVAMPGYPFVSLLPYGLDGACRPLFLLSRLAEHTKNLLVDPRASLMVADEGLFTGPLEKVRLTVLGSVERADLDESARSRFLRYNPESAEFIDWSDFGFYRLQPLKARFIGGFGRMGWLDTVPLPHVLEPREETKVLDRLAARVPAGMRVEGVDPEGIDLVVAGVRRRVEFGSVHTGPEALLRAAGDVLDSAGATEPSGPSTERYA